MICSYIEGYCFLVFLYGAIVISSDWQKYADLAMERAEVKKKHIETTEDEVVADVKKLRYN